MIKKINLQLRETQIISQPFKELLGLTLQHIAPLQHKPLNRRIGVDHTEQPALADRRQLAVIGVVDHLLVEVAGGLYARLEAGDREGIVREPEHVHGVAQLG